MGNNKNLNCENENDEVLQAEVLPDRSRDLIPCTCPQQLINEAGAIDAATVGRVVNFNLLIRNLCPNKPFIVCVIIYKIVGGVRVPLAQISEVITNTTGTTCAGEFVTPLTAVINEPICSNATIWFHVIGNYVNCCSLTF